MDRPSDATMDRTTATALQESVLRALEALFAAARDARELLSEPEFEGIGKALARVSSALDLEVLETIYRFHPDLRERDEGAYPPYETSAGRSLYAAEPDTKSRQIKPSEE